MKKNKTNIDPLLKNCHPVRWTLDVTKAGQLDGEGCVYVFAGGPIQTSVASVGPPRKRADGKIDGRSAGVRKCGRCQGVGHNARTCKNASVAKPKAAKKVPSGRKCGTCGKTGHNARTCGKKV